MEHASGNTTLLTLDANEVVKKTEPKEMSIWDANICDNSTATEKNNFILCKKIIKSVSSKV